MSEVAAIDESLPPVQLEALGEEIATFAARIDIAQHALITRLRVFDAHEAWGHTGFLSCAHWLAWRIGIGVKAAREKVRVARALGSLKKIDALFGRGELSYSKVRAMTRVATPESEQDFIDAAVNATASQVERITRAYRRALVDPSGQPRDQRRFVRRSETLGGMVRIEMQLPPEEAAVVWEAMMSAAERDDRCCQASAEASAPSFTSDAPTGVSDAPPEASAEASPPSSATEAPPASNATNSGPQASAEASTPRPAQEASAEASNLHPAPANDSDEHEQRRADAIVNVARAYLQHRPRTLGSGYELVVITSKDQLQQGPGGVGGFLRDGTPVPLHVARMLACDSARIDVVTGKHGELLDVGRSTRSIPSAIARALWLRDGGCRVPGCGRKRHLHGHHVEAWADGGPTRLTNLVLVCPAHHRMIHEGQLSTEIRAAKITFIDQRGRDIPEVPRPAATGHDLEELELFLREADLHLDPSLTMPKWDGTPMDLADTLAWMFIADETRTKRPIAPIPKPIEDDAPNLAKTKPTPA